VIAPSSEAVLLTAALSAFAVLMHELGHAAAAYRCGARRVSIGVGWYVAFPVAFADLSESWAWSRRQRMLVDLAGVWLQGLMATLYVVLHLATDDGVFLAAATAVSASMAWNLNPLLRMDGYWLLADWIGVPNLRREAAASVRFLWRTRSWPRSRPLWQWSVLTLYAVAATAFMGVMMFWALRHLWQMLPALPRLWTDSLFRLGHAVGVADILVVAGGLLVQALLLFAAVRLLYVPARTLLKQRLARPD
jgi:putative peptide zinc metalloprotease protein